MSAFTKFQRSGLLFKASLTILGRHPRLLVFPVVTLFFTSIILGFFLAPLALQPTGHRYTEGAHWKAVAESIFGKPMFQANVRPTGDRADAADDKKDDVSVRPAAADRGVHHLHAHKSSAKADFRLTTLGWLYAGTAYFLSFFLATFFNVAFYHEIIAALKGDIVSLRRGLHFAGTRWKSILAWTAFAGIVGALIRGLEDQFSWFGRWVVGLIGTAWSVACVFVVPVLVTSESVSNPLELLKRSGTTLKRTWGESLIGYAGVQFAGLIVLLGSLGLIGSAVVASALTGNWWFLGFTGLFWVLFLFTYAYVMSVVNQIYRCALYLYSAEGTLVEPYTADSFQSAWKVKSA
jgi:Family of unknown function (DUF6159)